MRLRVLALGLLLGSAIVHAPREAHAAPMHTDLGTVRKGNPTVVIGVVHQAAGAIAIDVDKVIQGAASVGTMTVAPSPDGHVDVDDERVVALLDGGALRWVGRVLAGPSIETGVLKLKGFFDFNAHIVSPGVMSLGELEGFLKTGKLDQTLAVTMVFHDAKGARVVSSKGFTVKWDAIARAVTSSTFVGACLKGPSMFPFDWGSVSLSFSDACPSAKPNARDRSLDVEGAFVGWDARAGALQVELEPSRPWLDEKEWDTFVADGTLATARTVVSVKLPDRTRWTWHVGDDLVDPGGHVFAAGGVSSSMQMKDGVTTSQDVYDFRGPKVVIAPSPGVGSPGGNALGLMPMIGAGTAGCTLRRGGQSVPCTLAREPTVFLPR